MNARHDVEIDRSPEEQARIDALRERFQRECPSLEELIANGEFEPPISQGEYWDMVEMLVALRGEREAAGVDVLNEHTRILERLPDALREKIGFKAQE